MHLASQETQLLQSNTIYCLSNTHNNKPGLHSPGNISPSSESVSYFLGPDGLRQFIKYMLTTALDSQSL